MGTCASQPLSGAGAHENGTFLPELTRIAFVRPEPGIDRRAAALYNLGKERRCIMAQMRLLCYAFLLLAALLVTVHAGVIVVDPAGGGDYDNIPEAAFHAVADDTVLVLPGTYTVGPALFPWPIPLTADSPTFLSLAGAAATIMEGDGTLPAFSVAGGETDARMFVHGFTLRSLERAVARNIYSYPGGPVHFTDNIVENMSCYYPALHAGSGPDGLIARNVFTGPGEKGIELGVEFAGVIEDNDVSGYQNGMVGAGAGVEIQRNHVHDCQSCGITAYGPLTASDNLVENCSYAGFMIDGTTYLEGNIIRGNGVGVSWPGALSNTPDGHVRLNDIYDNGTNISVPELMYDLDFDATTNWWGTSDPEEIADGIWDCHDPLAGYCCVIFEPWCTEPIPGCSPTAIAETSSWGTIKALYR